MSAGTSWVLGVDSGGSGLRVALAPAGGGPEHGRTEGAGPVRTGERGIDPGHMLEQLLPAARELLATAGGGEVAAACVGAAGMATLGGGLRAKLPGAFAAELGVVRLALAADAVTAYAGAVGERAGVVVAAGTGMIAMGTDLTSWRRADGWGHLLGDCGGGAWIGRAGLEAAMRAHDGREGGSGALLAAAEEAFGPVGGFVGQLYPRTDRAAVLASFAPHVARCAAAGDGTARGVLAEAAREIARAATAVCPGPEATTAPDGRPEVALTGGLFNLGEQLLAPLRAELDTRLPHARVTRPEADPLGGALRIAGGLAAGTLRLPHDAALLSVTSG